MSMPLPSEASEFPLMLRARFSAPQSSESANFSLLGRNDSLCDSLERKENPCYVSAHASLWALF